MTGTEKVELIRRMIQDYWGMTESADKESALVLVEMIGTVTDFGGAKC